MKKILLLIILILAVVFVGKYVYDKQINKEITLGGSDAASVSVSTGQTLVESGKSLKYTASIKVVNSTPSASSTFTFINMPVLYKQESQRVSRGNSYTMLTSVSPKGNIVDDATGISYPLTGPIYVIGSGNAKQFTVHATYANLPPGTYKVSLGVDGKSPAGYSINGGKRKPLPGIQTNAVTISSSTIATSTPAAWITFASSSLYKTISNATATPTGLEGRITVSLTAGTVDLIKMETAGQIDIINVKTGAVVKSYLSVVGGYSTDRYQAGMSYPITFLVNASAWDLTSTVAYKAVLRNVSVKSVNGVTTNIPLDPTVFTTNSVVY